MRGELAGESFDHADERAFAGGIVAVQRFAALPGGRADEHEVSGGIVLFGLLFFALRLHLRDGVLDESEDAVEIYGHGLAPLLGRHFVNRRVVGRPDAVISHQNVQPAKAGEGGCH